MTRQGLVAVAAAVSLSLLAGLGAGLPYWFGLEIEKALPTRLDALARSVHATVIHQRIERGWFSTEAETVLRLPALPFDLAVQHHLRHGPWPLERWLAGDPVWKPLRAVVRSHVRLRAPPAAEASSTPPALQALVAQLPPLIADTVVHLDGSGAMSFAHGVLRTKFDRGGELDWRGLQGALRFDARGQTLELSARAPGLSLSAAPAANAEALPPATALRLGPVSLDLRIAQQAGGHFFGESRLVIETLALSPMIEMHGLRFVSAAQPEGPHWTLALRYEFDRAMAGDQALGPARLAVALRQLDSAALARYRTELGALRRRDLPPEQASLVILGKTLELVAGLAKNAPELELSSFSLRSGSEEIRAHARFVLDGSRLDVVQNPLLLVVALKGEAELVVPARLLASWYLPRVRQQIEDYARRGLISQAQAARLTPERLATIAEQALPHYLASDVWTRLLVREGADYKLRLSVRQGQVLLNNEPWQLMYSTLP